MMNRSLGWMLMALGLSAVAAGRASGQGDASAPLPDGVTACHFSALANPTDPPDPAGPVLRDAPRPDGRELARLPIIDDNGPNRGHVVERPVLQVIGFKDGWFLIDGASYPEPYASEIYVGRGWIDGKFVTTHLFRDTLKKAPTNESPDVSYLYGTSDGSAYRPYNIGVSRVLGCSGQWLEVEIYQPTARTVFGKPVATNDGTLRGWTDRSCVEQDHPPCTGTQFDYPWSPLPAGVTECNFGALSNDRDPAGLNVHEAPDLSAPVVGRLLPPTDIGNGTMVRATVQVIGYRKGWFLIETGPYNDFDFTVKGRPRPYTGRGWVVGTMLTAELLRDRLKQAPSETSADVVLLQSDAGADPQNVKMRRLMACSGDWTLVEIALENGLKPLLDTHAPKGAMRGWANGTCTEELTTCDYGQGRPWPPPAPLPPE